MAIDKTQDGAWILYMGTPAELTEALQDDGVTADQLLGFSFDDTNQKHCALVKKGSSG